jgi:hypothetical protein
VPQSLHRTWAALALAAIAVLVVAFLTGRDFLRDVYPECPASIVPLPTYSGSGKLEPVFLDTADPSVPTGTRSFALRFDQKLDPRVAYGARTAYSNVRVVLNDVERDGRPCTCGSIPVHLLSEGPSDLSLYREKGTDLHVLKGRFINTEDHDPNGDVRIAFRLLPGATRHLQSDRILTQRHLPALVVILALGALVVALFRSRRAMSYALRLHAWREVRLTPEGVIESESGTPLGTLEQMRGGALARRPGPVLVAPDALPSGSLYRDMCIVERRNVAEGTHALWAGGTMVRLRDARALAIISTACTLLAFGARLVA